MVKSHYHGEWDCIICGKKTKFSGDYDLAEGQTHPNVVCEECKKTL